MAMYDIKRAKRVRLDENITDQKYFARLRDVGDVTGRGNKVQAGQQNRSGIFGWLNQNLFMVALATIVGTATLAALYYFVPGLKGLVT